jgi:hypothetical protein
MQGQYTIYATLSESKGNHKRSPNNIMASSYELKLLEFIQFAILQKKMFLCNSICKICDPIWKQGEPNNGVRTTSWPPHMNTNFLNSSNLLFCKKMFLCKPSSVTAMHQNLLSTDEWELARDCLIKLFYKC